MATSRTAEGKHTKRFIVLKKGTSDTDFTRSVSLPGFYGTRELAQAAIDANAVNYPNVQYKVRQK
jgi:hypothetical protein